ncbi:MAG TPA: hypothetical protein VGN57_04755 [Pirellulaceae bacterium]|jgi:hypothetical protein|nr:hypothetical protein [Pirellulaceae bacterium]
MIRFVCFSVAAFAALAFAAEPAGAHFVYLKQSAGANATKAEGFFGHAPEPAEPRLLANLEGLEVWWTPAKGERTLVPLSLSGDRMVGSAPAGPGTLTAKRPPRVREREGVTYRSVGYAQAAPPLESGANVTVPAEIRPDLELQAGLRNGKLSVTALWKGKPLPHAEFSSTLPGQAAIYVSTDEHGSAEFELNEPGFIHLHVQHVVPGEGELDGEKFTETRHNATLVVETAGKSDASR